MVERINSNQPTKRNNARLMLTTATGAALGAGARYIVPTKNELQSAKTATDSFFSNASTLARGANRSILKYSAIGAVIAGGAYLLTKLFNNKKVDLEKYYDSFEYSKYRAIIDAPEYACEMYLYED